jgi:quercetin dioxygenase-like cupin family protein
MEKVNPVELFIKTPVPEFPSKKNKNFDGWVEYSTNGKNNKARNLLSEAGISVANWFSSKGYIFPLHSHTKKEWLIIYKGSMEIFIQTDGKTESKLLKEGDYIFLATGIEHQATFPEDCWYIAITIPQSFEWPN